MKATTLIFDLDNTLYSPKNGLWDALSQRISDFMQFKMSIPQDKIESLRKNYRRSFGSTYQGLKIQFSINEKEYLDYVHDIDLEQFISEDKNLCEILFELPQRKVIFTNADQGHTNRVLKILGVADHFDQIVDIQMTKPYCKPQIGAFITALNHFREPFPHNCAFIDDSQLNLTIAKRMGFLCIEPWTSISMPNDFVQLESIYDLGSISFS